jgi:hypothetical protein
VRRCGGMQQRNSYKVSWKSVRLLKSSKDAEDSKTNKCDLITFISFSLKSAVLALLATSGQIVTELRAFAQPIIGHFVMKKPTQYWNGILGSDR